MDRKEGAAVPLSRESWVPVTRLTQCGHGRGLLPYQVASSSIQPFGHNKHRPKTGAVPLLGGAATPSNTTSPWPRFTSVPMRHLDSSSRLATIDIGQKLGMGAVPFFPGGAGSTSNSKSPGPRPTSIPSGILVHLVVWPQRTLAENCGGSCAL